MREYGYETELILHDAYISLPGRAPRRGGRGRGHLHHPRLFPPLPARRPDRSVVDVGGGDDEDFAGADVRGPDRADRRHRQPGGDAARVPSGRSGPDPCQPARAPARDVRLAGLGQPDCTRTSAAAQHGGGLPLTRRTARARPADRSRRLAVTLTPRSIRAGARRRSCLPNWPGPEPRSALHPVQRPPRRLVLRRDGQWRRQRHHDGGRPDCCARIGQPGGAACGSCSGPAIARAAIRARPGMPTTHWEDFDAGRWSM